MTEPPPAPKASGGYQVPLGRPRTARLTTARPKPKRATTNSSWSTAGIVLILIAMALYAIGQWVLTRRSGATTGLGLVVAPILIVLTMVALSRSTKAERDFDLRGLVLTSIGLRLVFAFPRFLAPVDAVVYNNEGARLATQFRQLNFVNVDVGSGAAVPGTGSLRYIAGLGHLFTDSNFFGTTMLFTFGAFWATWWFYRAFVIAVPSGDRARYAKLIMLWPSLLYWPSSIGKDSWMLLTIALAALGTAKILTRGRGGFVLAAIGLAGSALVRPHVSLLVFGAMLIAYLIGRRDQNRIPGTVNLGGITKALGVAVLLVGGALLAPTTAHFLKLDSISSAGLSSAFSATQAKTAEGNSAYHAVNPNSPIGYPLALFTVLYRPLPGELRNLTGLAASAESFALLLITIVGWRRLVGAFRRLRSEAYITFTLAYIAMFGYAFSAISNFGILTRERVQVLPFLFVPLSLNKWHREPAQPARLARSIGSTTTSP